MRRKHPVPQATGAKITPRDRRKATVPAVPTFRPDEVSIETQSPSPAPKEDPAEEAVRRMVEAAYT